MKLKPLVTIVCLLFAMEAYAHEAGEFFVRGGLAAVAPHESSDGIAIPALGMTAIAGTNAEVGNDTQLGLTVNYMFSPNIGIELLGSTPFSHDITANLNGYSPGLKVKAGESKQLPPTVSVVYYPMGNASGALQPYVGLGVNYTIFFKKNADPELESLTGTLAGTSGPVPLDLHLDNSVGVALQGGLDYSIDNRWHVNAAVRWINIETDATFTSSLGDTIVVKNVKINPWVFQLTLGYKF
jgi:outer membrane protein